MGRRASLVQVHVVVQTVRRLAARRAPGVNRRDDSPAVRLVHPYEASAREDPSGQAAQQSHAR